WATAYGGSKSTVNTLYNTTNAAGDMGYSIQSINGNVWVSGKTSSPNFPVLNPGCGSFYQDTIGPPNIEFGTVSDFILQFDTAGVRKWATYYGNDGENDGNAASADATNLFIAGDALYEGYPVTNPGGGAYYTDTMYNAKSGEYLYVGKFCIGCSSTTVIASSSVNICKGNSAGLTASGASSYSWSPSTGLSATNIPNPVANPTVTTTYTVTGTASGCTGTILVTVTVDTIGTINITGPDSICKGGLTTLTAKGATSYTWSPSAGLSSTSIANPVVSPTVTTTYTVNATSGGCIGAAKDSVIVTVTNMPVASVHSGAAFICKGDSTVLTASGGIIYTWKPATGLSASTGSSVVARPVSSTTYTAEVSNGICTTDTTIIIKVNKRPVPTIFASNLATCPGDSVQLTASGGISYKWSTGATKNAIYVKPLATTTYYVTANNGSCTGDTNIVISLFPAPAISVKGTDTICKGDSTILTASGGTNYSWSPWTGLNIQTGPTVTAKPLTTTTYTLSVSNSYCVKDTTIVITVTSSIAAKITPALTTICTGDTALLTASGGTNYAWNTGATTNSVKVFPATTTTYSVKVSSGSCTNNASAQVTVTTPPIALIKGITSICLGDSTQLTASGGTGYIWNTGATTAPIYVKPSFTTTYSVIVSNGACTKDTNAVVTVNPVPNGSVSGNTSVCTGGHTILTASGGTTYLWSTGATTNNITIYPASSTTYKVTIGQNACTDTISAFVTVTPIPISACCNTTISVGQSVQLSSSGGVLYSWLPASGLSCDTCANPFASPNTTTIYTVTITSDSGCSSSTIVTIDVACGSVFVPEAFSPNNDGQNDVLYVRGNCINTLDFIVFDRWGNKVFETNDKTNGWNGMNKGQDMNTGSYVYYLKATMYDGTTTEKKGNVTLVR
ncbi:MAG TPA: gliding motility-associated C-terminal domain-containing protein, partial [Bacteroidia bacterium]|nr:gliding motility-associated C-terminal domain-containing protein [Bacteroidia bacterium]